MSNRPTLLSLGSWPESRRVAEILRKETVGGMILLVAAAAAIIWANSPWADAYFALRDFKVGGEPGGLHLDLTIGTGPPTDCWPSSSSLSVWNSNVSSWPRSARSRRAALPIAAAVGGMAVPALIFVAVAAREGDGAAHGWAIPTATDIAFAVAVLAVLSTHLPSALRMFLLTLAVVDDLLAITVIAIFYTDQLNTTALALAFIPLAVFACACSGASRPGGS
jgi:NhaA family Na+:H+ antiporter